MLIYFEGDQASLFDPASCVGKMSPEYSPVETPRAKTSGSYWKKSSELISIPYQYLDLTPGAGNLLGEYEWEIRSPLHGESLILNTGPAPRSGAAGSSLWQILEDNPHRKYYLTRKACRGILRRSKEREKILPRPLMQALEVQSGLRSLDEIEPVQKSYHINQRSEGIDLNGVSGALMATQNLQMQTFITNPAQGVDGYNGDLTGDVSATLGTNCGMSTGRNGILHAQPVGLDSKHACTSGDVANTLSCGCGSSTGRNGVVMPIAFAQNQRDEVRDLHDVAGALSAQPSIKQQTFIAAGFCAEASKDARGIGYQEECSVTLKANSSEPSILCFKHPGEQPISPNEGIPTSPDAQREQPVYKASGVVSKGNGDCFLTENTHTSLTGGGGQAGQGYPCVLVSAKAPSILCLNDQGGQVMSCSENITGTLRAEEHGHQPLLLESNQHHAAVREDGISTTLPASMGMGGGYVPMVYENHGIDSRYKGPLDVAPTMSARYGTGGNNVPLVGLPPETYCLVGNIIDRKPQNGAGGIGCQANVAYALTTVDRHAVYSKPRTPAEQGPEAYCLVGNIIDRQPQNGGNGIGCQEDIAYTLTATDRHAVFSRQRTDAFQENKVVSTESARQHKDATDLVMQPYQQTVGTLGYTDHKGINNQYVGEDKCVVDAVNLIRRLTPLECERLQGFPDGWTDIPDASDSARYKALGNSVAIPCVDFVINGIAIVLRFPNQVFLQL